MNGTALAVGVGAIALVLVWSLATAKAAPAPGGVGTPLGTVLPTSPAALAATAIFHPNVINHAIFGVGTDSFPTFGDQSDFQKLAQNMCQCYHGNTAACTAAKEQSALRTCQPGDCDCHPTNPSAGVISYRDSHGGPYTGTFGPKVPIGGCQGNTPGAISNRQNGYCAGLVAA